MRLRALLRGQFYRSRLGGFILWLLLCGALFVALDLYFEAHLIVSTGGTLSGASQTRLLKDGLKQAADDPKLRAADLASLREGGGGGGASQSENGERKHRGPRQRNPHRLNDHLQICKHPKLDLENDANKAAYYEMTPLVCLGRSLFSVTDGVLSLNRSLLGGHRLGQCVYRGIERLDDSFPTYTQKLVRLEEPFEIKIKHDFFRIQCSLQDQAPWRRRFLGTGENDENSRTNNSYNSHPQLRDINANRDSDVTLNEANTGEDVNNDERTMALDVAEDDPDFDQFIAQVYPSDEVSERIDRIRKETAEAGKSQDDPLDVLVVCLDSLSHLSYQRKLPLTYQFLRSELGATILHGYNIVGDATSANLLPLLTGKAHHELPEARLDIADSNYVDTYPLLWYKYEKRGYATLFAEDEPSIGMFNLRLNGFEHQPTDHYMRPFWQTAWSSSLNRNSLKFCLGDKPKHRYTLDYARDFFRAYGKVPKFAFVMHSELTHWDNNPGQFMDADLRAFLSGLRTSGALDRTVLILMGDHGARYSKVRWTVQGKLEERLPMMAWVLPDAFAARYPALVQNFKANAHRLTTPFDVHETLLDVLDASRTSKPAKASSRGLSLFQSVPLNRTCKSAGIDMHWCTCLTQEVVEPSNEHVQNSAAEVLRTINRQTESLREICAPLTLQSIKSAMLVVPNEKVLRYRFSQDDDNRVANFSSAAKLDIAYYQLTLVTAPGGGFYEATVQANFLTSTYTVSAEVSRVNMYGAQAECVKSKYPSMRKYCYCKETPVDG